METKICMPCRRNLPISDFYLVRGMKDGLDRYCKECRLKTQKDARSKNPEKYREIDRRKRERAKEKYTEVYLRRLEERKAQE